MKSILLTLKRHSMKRLRGLRQKRVLQASQQKALNRRYTFYSILLISEYIHVSLFVKIIFNVLFSAFHSCNFLLFFLCSRLEFDGHGGRGLHDSSDVSRLSFIINYIYVTSQKRFFSQNNM